MHYCVGYSVEHRPFEMCAATFAWSYAANDICAVFNHLRCMKSAFSSCKPLYQYFGIFINENAHVCSLSRAKIGKKGVLTQGRIIIDNIIHVAVVVDLSNSLKHSHVFRIFQKL